MPKSEYYHQLALSLFQQAKQATKIKEADDLRAMGREMEAWARVMEDADAGSLHSKKRAF